MASQAEVDDPEVPARFRVLGLLDVRSEDGAPVPVNSPLNRRVLATLLLFAGTPCTGSFLARAIWGQRPPGKPGHSLNHAVYGLRRSLGSSGGRLESPDGGCSYMFAAAASEVDAALFEDLARQGRSAWYRGDTGQAARLLAAAARLWRDPALADVPETPVLAGLRDTLLRARLDVEELSMDARLVLGGHRGAVSDLRRMLAGDPLREHAWAQLMVALYRDGRTGEALRAFRDANAALQAECGCGPGPELTEIRSQVLAGSLDLLAGGTWLASRPAPEACAGAGIAGRRPSRSALIPR